MQRLFAIVLVILLLASVATWLARPEQQLGKPVLYWVTDPNPVRQSQVDAFHAWAETHVPEADRFELRIDSANRDSSKKIIQSVSGVGGEIMDIDLNDVGYYQQIGIAVDLTDAAAELGFEAERTYPAIAPGLRVDGRQYAFPCNIPMRMYWVNVGSLRRYGLALPERAWTWAEFEALATTFAERANEGLDHRRRFLTNRVDLLVLTRNHGVDLLNETLTAATLGDPVVAAELARIHRWTFDDHILPSKADLDSLSTEAAHGGSAPQMFRRGEYAMLHTGRWALCQLRLFDDFPELELAVLPPPDGGFQNTSVGSRAALVNAGSRHPELAVYFMQFLASPEYSRTIVDSADALPPLPEATAIEAFRRPPDFPNEWGSHEVFAWALEEIALPVTGSPFVSSRFTTGELWQAEEAVMATPSLRTPEEAGAYAARRIDERIQLNLDENPDLRPAYEAALERQAEIDRRKAAGEKIPRALISNGFHLRYYAAKGMLE